MIYSVAAFVLATSKSTAGVTLPPLMGDRSRTLAEERQAVPGSRARSRIRTTDDERKHGSRRACGRGPGNACDGADRCNR